MVRTAFVLVLGSLLCASATAAADYPDDCPGLVDPAGECLDGLTYEGCCDDQGRLVWCEDGLLFCIDCTAADIQCGWSAVAGFYDCGNPPEEDPSGQNPIDCIQCEPACEPGYKCQGGECVVCQPECAGKACGSDGCSGSCGECKGTLTCQQGQCVSLGCTENDFPGCGGCQCEQCVCELDGFCCDVAWDSLCVDECIDICGGCASLENCDDGECAGNEGENCGTCPSDCLCEDGEVCFQYACCMPDCLDKECGSDGCGGSCGTCEPAFLCGGTGLCEPVPTCEVVGAFHCNEIVKGTTEGHENLLSNYVCAGWSETGPEVGYQFHSAVDDLLVVELTGVGGADLDLMLVEGACSEYSCLEYGDDSIEWNVEAGVAYFIIIDGYDGESGAFELSVKCQSTCEPDCEGKTCGDDGCWGQCGDCGGGTCFKGLCHEGPGCESTFDAGCGGCPCEACVCAMDSFCCNNSWDGLCVNECIQDCVGCLPLENCGDDLCTILEGETCSNCPEDCLCQSGEVCFDNACCAPVCEGVECGDDGCGGDCGDCPSGEVCVDGSCGPNDGCVEADVPGCPGCLCEPCVCTDFPECCQFEWSWLCVMICQEWCSGCGLLENCGNDQCDVSEGENCGNCGDDCGCDPDGICYQYECCVPSCEGKDCGGDGCGGACGTCPPGEFCDQNGDCGPNNGCVETYELGCGGCQCEACVCAMDSYCCYSAWDGICVSECEWDCGGCVSLTNCGDDICDGPGGEDCDNCEDCECAGAAVCNQGKCESTCVPQCDDMYCGPDGCGGSCGECPDGFVCDGSGGCVCEPICDPGQECGPNGCGGECGECPGSSECQGGICVCQPTCLNRECGDDGCGGSCGECDKGSYCDAEGSCQPLCVPACDDKECGDDGCQGSCGDCPFGQVCQADGTCSLSRSPDVVESVDILVAADGVPDSVEAEANEAELESESADCSGCASHRPAGPNGTGLVLLLSLVGLAVLRRGWRGWPKRGF